MKWHSLLDAVKSRDVLTFLAAAMLVQFSHSTYYGFLSIYLESLGHSKTTIGLLWALGPAGEIVIMLTGSSLLGKFGALPVLLFSLVMAVVRWGIFAVTDNIAALVPAQLLHAFTFGACHIASVRHVEKLFPEHMKNTAQALYSSSSFGAGLVMGTLISGLLYDRIGAGRLFLLSAAAALAALVILRPARRDCRSGIAGRL